MSQFSKSSKFRGLLDQRKQGGKEGGREGGMEREREGGLTNILLPHKGTNPQGGPGALGSSFPWCLF